MVLTEKILDEILNYLDNSISKLSQETVNNSESQMNDANLEEFLSNQYEIRLGNLLQRKNSDIHHLESGMKNKIIQRKQKRIDIIMKNFTN